VSSAKVLSEFSGINIGSYPKPLVPIGVVPMVPFAIPSKVYTTPSKH